MATSSAATAAGGIVQPLPQFNYSGPNAGVYLQKQNEAELAYQQAVADLQQKKNTAYHQYGLDSAGAVDPYSQFGMYQSQLSKHESDLSATDEAAQQRGLGAAGLAMQGERALKYQQGAEDLALQSDVANIGQGYSSGQQAALAARNQAILDAQLQAIQMGGAGAVSAGTIPPGTAGPPGSNPPPPPGPPSAGSKLPPGTLPSAAPSGARAVWDVNDPSTYWGVNSAAQGGAGLVIAPDADPESALKYQAAVQAGVPVSIAINADANDTPQTLAAKIAAAKQQYPGASFTLDLESQNFRGGAGSTNWNNMQNYANAAIAAAGGTPITVSTEGVSDFNYGAWNQAGTQFAPQAYWGDMSPRDVDAIAQMLIAQGIDPASIFPLIAPGQDIGSWTGGYGLFGVPTTATQSWSGAKPLNKTQLQTLSDAGLVDSSQSIQKAYQAALPAPTTALGTLARKLVYSSSRPGLE